MRDAVAKVMNRTPGFELEKPGAETKTAEQIAAEKKAADDKAAADAAAAGGKTPEQIAAEKKAAEDKAAADAAAAGEPNPLDKLGPLPVETLAKAITENPELAAALEKAGLDPEVMYETSRRAALSDQYAEVFPTVDSAKFAADSANHFYDIEQGFPKVSDLKSFDDFVTGTMLPLSVLRDPKTGDPLTNPDGSYQTDGSIGRFFEAANQMETVMGVRAVDAQIKAAEAQGEAGEETKQALERIKDALILAQEFRDNGYKVPKASGNGATQRSPEDQKLIDDANRTRQEAEKRNEEARQAEIKTFDDSVFNETTTAASNFVAGVLNRTALDDYTKASISDKVNAEAWEALGKNRHFQAQKAHLQTLPATPETKKQLVTLAKLGFEREAKRVLEREIQAAGGKLMTRSQQKQAKQETQQANDKMNQGSGTAPNAKGPALQTGAQIREQAIKNLKAAGVAYPDDGEILAESLRLRKATQVA